MTPSVNALYIQRGRGKGIALSTIAKDYRNTVKKIMRKMIVETSQFEAGNPETAYDISFWCYFKRESLENPGWFEFWASDGFRMKDDPKGRWKKGDRTHQAGERKAKSRYKSLDTDNRIKFAQDCVVKGLGIPNDCQIMDDHAYKRVTKGDEHVIVKLKVMDPSEVFGGTE